VVIFSFLKLHLFNIVFNETMKKSILKFRDNQIQLIESDPIIIGRHGYSADIEIEDTTVSKKHAVVVLREGTVYLMDSSSANGVYLREQRIAADDWIPLDEGDTFSIGSCHFKTEYELSEDFPQSNEVIESVDLKSQVLQYGRIAIGREVGSDIQLEDPSISRYHAVISYEKNKFWLEDLKSTNGTYLNGQKIHGKVELLENDNIVISLTKISLSEGVIDLKTTKAAISAVSISKTYPNGKMGLQNLSIDIPRSRIVALMGPSGCGKSTLLKCLNGDNPATSGQVYIHGLPLNKENYNLLKKKIGYVPQDDIIHQELTVYRTLYYAAKLRLPDDTTAQEIEARINKVINSLNLAQDKEKDIREVRVKELSGGQRKRVSIAVELLIEPTILFLDEPTSPLDPESIDSFLRSLQKLAEEGTTVIMVTHKPEDLAYADDVIFLMIKGYLTYFGNSAKLVEKFGVTDIVQVYAKLSDKDILEANIKEYYLEPNEEGSGLFLDEDLEKNHDDSPVKQCLWLSCRYLEIKASDWSNLFLLFLQPAIVGSLLCVIFDELQVGVLFLMAISSIWFGVSNAAKEIVGELSVYQRERMFNLGLHPYIISKMLVLSLVSLSQIFIFVGIIYLRFKVANDHGFSEVYLKPFFDIVFFMFYLSISASLVGLFLSAIFDSTERVMTVVPISLMPQVMLAGLVAKINDPLVEFFSFFTLGRWGTEGLARLQDAGATIHDAGQKTEQLWSVFVLPPGAIEKQVTSALKLLNYYDASLVESGKLLGQIFDSFGANIIAISVLNLAFYFLIYFSLKKKDKI
jgi:ABC-type multidrug transport system ATPase subunit